MQEIIDFIREVDRLKGIERKTKPLGLQRYENSAEHSWQLAVMVLSLSRYAAAPIDVLQTIKMLLLHDIGEIDTGDTIVYATAIREEKKKEEQAAVERICGILPKETGDEFLALWLEFEAAETKEARFAKAIDRLQPLLINTLTGGGTWNEFGVTEAQAMDRYGAIISRGSPALWQEASRLVAQHFAEQRKKA